MEQQQKQVDSSTSPQKIKFARHAEHAQLADAKPHLVQVGQIITPDGGSSQVNQETPSKVLIAHEYGSPGRPRKDDKNLRLPPGLKTLRRGRSVYSEDIGEQFIEAYYENGGSFSRACRQAGVRFASARAWIQEYPEFGRAIQEVDDIIKDEVHSQFMTRVLHEWEPNPAWKFKYFNKNFPEYSETKKTVKVSFQLKDTLIRPEEIIEGEVVRKQLEPGDADRSKQFVEPPANTS